MVTFFDLLMRCLGWALLFAVVLIPLVLVVRAVLGGPSWNPLATTSPHGWSAAIAPVLISAVTVWIISRYLFVAPMLALHRGSMPYLIDNCLALAKPMRVTAILIVLAQSVPNYARMGFQHVAASHADLPPAINNGLSLAWAILASIVYTWFAVFTTSLMIQVMSEYPAAEPGNLPSVADGLTHNLNSES
jgi:hypothetical protein